eukprot:219364_1
MSTQSQWVCHVCTYHNHAALPRCEICESDRESKPSIDYDLKFAQEMQEIYNSESIKISMPIQTTKIQHKNVSNPTHQTPNNPQIDHVSYLINTAVSAVPDLIPNATSNSKSPITKTNSHH